MLKNKTIKLHKKSLLFFIYPPIIIPIIPVIMNILLLALLPIAAHYFFQI